MQTSDQLSELAINPILQACKQALVEHYAAKFKGLVLFGSAARQELTPDSDIDLLVLLDHPLDYFQELRTIIDILYPLQLESSHWVSTKLAAMDEFEGGMTQLYRNAKEEGIFL
jgi:predicted nucleotidyltransferase